MLSLYVKELPTIYLEALFLFCNASSSPEMNKGGIEYEKGA